MKNVRMRTFIVIFNLLVYCSVATISSEARVLCFGSDGHIAVEAANNDCCSLSGSLPQDHPMTDFGFPSGHCGLCLDIPFSINNESELVFSHIEAALLIKTLALKTLSYILPPFVEVKRSYPFPQVQTINSSFLASLRTVILLT